MREPFVNMKSLEKPLWFVGCVLLVLWGVSCSSGTGAKGRSTAPGFFEQLSDQWSERQCHVIRFTCPYGRGPAGEPCECTDPRGVVLSGRTIK